uniref:Periodic tryptophan protein 2 n=1 Tax=Panagrolaimus sp. PS1159 TaxID=55785 RepID=A0AC35G765_9BILA
MNINYEFSDMIGSSYKNGNISFLGPHTVVSPVGNKIKVFNIKENSSWTLPVQSSFNITILEISPTGKHAFAVNEAGIGQFINLHHGTVLYRMRFGDKARVVKFSPDGKKLAVCTGGTLTIYRTTFRVNGLFNPFSISQIRKLSNEALRTLSWSYDSRLVVCGGDDKRLWIVDATKKLANITAYGLSAHRSAIVGCYFLNQGSLDVCSIDDRGSIYVWECALTPNELIFKTGVKEADDEVDLIEYTRKSKERLTQHLEGNAYELRLTSTTYNQKTQVLTVGYAHGVFLILEMPTCNVIQNMRASDFRISTLSMNEPGDWLAFGCGEGSQSQLVVWEWQSESFVLKQQSHSQSVLTAAFSPDGSLLATGAEDGKIKIWNTTSSFCIVTFTEHTAAVSAVTWTQSGKAIVSAALDGTIRCHDIKRYRNFRTMTCPRPTQLSSLVVDDSSELVVASSKELFEVYVFSMDTGDLVDNFSGHSNIISKMDIRGSNLATISLDRTLRISNVVDQSQSEAIKLSSEGLDVKFSPCGKYIAALTYDSSITFFNAGDRQQIGIIDTRLDVDSSRLNGEFIKKSTSAKAKSFTCITFSPDSLLILAAGQSNYFCLYSVDDRVLIRKFMLTLNKSLDGVRLDIDYRKISEFGNLELFESSDEENDHIPGTIKRKTKLPGTSSTDMGERSYKPVMRVNAVDFNPTNRSFAVVSTEGIALYSLDNKRRFDPFDLEVDVTPLNVKQSLQREEYTRALSMSLRLNQRDLVRTVVFSIHWEKVKYIVAKLSIVYIEKLLKMFADEYQYFFSTEFHLFHKWLSAIFACHGQELKNPSVSSRQQVLASLTALQQVISTQNQQVINPISEAKSTLEFLTTARMLKKLEIYGESDKEETEVIDIDDD